LATLLAACGANSGANGTGVDLTYTKSGRLTGSFGGRRVDLTSKMPIGTGTVSGTVAGKPVDGNWQIAHNGTAPQTVLPVTLHGSLAQQSILLNSVFRLMPDLLFDSGTVTGSSGGRPVHAELARASGESTSSLNVDGTFSGTAFSLYATLNLDGRGLVQGTVGGRPVRLTAKTHANAIHISGDYSGPSALFVLAAGSLIYFLGGIYV